MAQANVGGATYTSNSKTPYVDIYNQYSKNLDKQINTYKQNQQSQQNQDISKLNSAYDSNARQYYIQSQQAQKGLNDRLASQGINGGASESAMLRMNSAYGQNIAKNESGRASDISSTKNTYANSLSDYLAQQEAARSNAYTTMMQNQAEYEEKQREKDLTNYAGSITNRWNNKNGYMNEIKRLRKSNDPQKQQKIALVQQAYTNWLLQKQQSSGGGGGSRGYSSGYGGGYGDGSSPSSPGDAAKEAAGKTTANIVNGLANGIIAQTNKGNKNKGKNKNKSSYGQYYSGDWRRYY